jgi:hypothetical protein
MNAGAHRESHVQPWTRSQGLPPHSHPARVSTAPRPSDWRGRVPPPRLPAAPTRVRHPWTAARRGRILLSCCAREVSRPWEGGCPAPLRDSWRGGGGSTGLAAGTLHLQSSSRGHQVIRSGRQSGVPARIGPGSPMACALVTWLTKGKAKAWQERGTYGRGRRRSGREGQPVPETAGPLPKPLTRFAGL